MSLLQSYQPQDAIYPMLGLDSRPPGNMLDSRLSPSISNIDIKDGVALKRKGYRLLGEQLDKAGVAVTDPVLLITEFETLAGVKVLVVSTNKRQYKYDFGSEAWVDITKRRTAQTLTNVNTGTKTFTFQPGSDLTADYPTGGTVAVAGSTGNDGDYNIASSSYSAPNLDVVVVEAIPDATVDGTIASHVELNGSATNWIDHVQAVNNSGRWLILTNNLDDPIYWDGTGQFQDLDMSTFPSFASTKSLASFFDHLMLGNVTDASSNPQLLGWSDIAEFETWASGDAGIALLSQAQGEILAMLPLGQRLAIYARNSIELVSFVAGVEVFATEHLISGIHIMSQRSVVDIGPWHMFLGLENFYAFDGTRRLVPVGDRVRISLKQDLDRENSDLAFAFHDSVRKRVFWSIPTSATTQKMYVMEYDLLNILESRWTIFEYSDQLTSLGLFSNQGALTWHSSLFDGVSWDEMSLLWNEDVSQTNFPMFTLGGQGKVYLNEIFTSDDGGVGIDAEWVSKDFIVPVEFNTVYGRWLEIEFEAKGTSLEVYVSGDLGVSWTLVDTVTLTDQLLPYKVAIDERAKNLRVRFRDAEVTGYFTLNSLRLWVRSAGV